MLQNLYYALPLICNPFLVVHPSFYFTVYLFHYISVPFFLTRVVLPVPVSIHFFYCFFSEFIHSVLPIPPTPDSLLFHHLLFFPFYASRKSAVTIFAWVVLFVSLLIYPLNSFLSSFFILFFLLMLSPPPFTPPSFTPFSCSFSFHPSHFSFLFLLFPLINPRHPLLLLHPRVPLHLSYSPQYIHPHVLRDTFRPTC